MNADEPQSRAVSNLPEFTVSEISGAVKRTLETTFGRIRVRGEITELKRYPSGHIYLTLKDENARISGVVWKFAVPRLGMAPENGVEVIATGRISAYAERSSYQLVIERLDYAGAGALLARIEALRVRLAEEGVFDQDRKQAIPRLPGLIGLVTSEQGAVLQDIRTTIGRRFPRDLLLWPVPVQGDDAVERIVQAIEGFDAMAADGPVPRPELLIVARGGGSLEDLMAFNDERVVRAVAACRIPVISAVGHETDTTLIDFVADRRAPTPTAAAEMAVPARVDLLADVEAKRSRLIGALNRMVQTSRLRLSRAERGVPDMPNLVGGARQRLDDRAARLAISLPNLIVRKKALLAAGTRHLPDLPGLLRTARLRLDDRRLRLDLALPNLVSGRRAAHGLAAERLQGALRHALGRIDVRAHRILGRFGPAATQSALREQRARLQGAMARLQAVSPLAVLARGYALVSDSSGHPLTSAAAITPGKRFTLRFHDGERRATADGGRRPDRQGELAL